MFTYRLTSAIWQVHFTVRKLRWNLYRYRCRIATYFRWEISRVQLFLLGVSVGFMIVVTAAAIRW